MPYDLYGQHYASRRDAENAEMAQCAAIEASIAYSEIENIKRQMQYQQDPRQQEQDFYYMQQHIQSLEERVQKLEELLTSITTK